MKSGRKTRNRVTLGIAVVALALAGIVAVLADAPMRVSAGSLIAVGDVMVSVNQGLVDEFTPAGVFVQTLDTTKGGGDLTTGSAFDSSGNFYVTDFNANDVSKFDPSANLSARSGAVTTPTTSRSCLTPPATPT